MNRLIQADYFERKNACEICYIFEDWMGIHTENISQKKIFVLLKYEPIVCCYGALYHSDYLSFVSKDELFENCLVDITLSNGGLC